MSRNSLTRDRSAGPTVFLNTSFQLSQRIVRSARTSNSTVALVVCHAGPRQLGGLDPVEKKIAAGEAARDQALEPVQVVETVLAGFPDGRQKRLARILAQQAQQLPQGNSHHLAAPLFHSR